MPTTSQKIDRIYPLEVRIDPKDCGLELPSKAMANQARTIDKSLATGVYGLVAASTMKEVDSALQLTVGLVEL